MKELPLMYLLNNGSVYCQQTQHSLLVSGLLSVLCCNWRRKVGVLLLGDNSESNTSGLCVALHTLYHLVWSYLFGVVQKRPHRMSKIQNNNLHGGGAGLIGLSVSANSPGPAWLTAATRNSYGRPSTRPLTWYSVSGTSPTQALKVNNCNFFYLATLFRV